MAGQSPLAFVAVTPAGSYAPGHLDPAGNLMVATNGRSSALALAAGQHIVKGAPGRIGCLIVNTAGTAGDLQVNDAATTAAIGAGNLIWGGATEDTLTANTIVVLNFPCQNGIAVTVPTGGVVSVSFD
jgi:hypothetical protein